MAAAEVDEVFKVVTHAGDILLRLITEIVEQIIQSQQKKNPLLKSLIKELPNIAAAMNGSIPQAANATLNSQVAGYLQQSISSQKNVEQMITAFGADKMAYMQVPNNTMQPFQQALETLHVPYALQRTQGDTTIVQFNKDHLPTIQVAMEQAKGQMLQGPPEGTTPVSVETSLEGLVQHQGNDVAKVSFILAEVQQQQVEPLDRALNKANIPHRFADLSGDQNLADRSKDIILTFNAANRDAVQEVFKQNGARLNPLLIEYNANGCESHMHKVHREKFEAQSEHELTQDLAKDQSFQEQPLEFKQALDIPDAQAPAVEQLLRDNKIPYVKEEMNGLTDFLIAGDNLNKANKALQDVGMDIAFTDVAKSGMDGWEQRAPSQVSKVRSRAMNARELKARSSTPSASKSVEQTIKPLGKGAVAKNQKTTELKR